MSSHSLGNELRNPTNWGMKLLPPSPSPPPPPTHTQSFDVVLSEELKLDIKLHAE